MADNDDIVQNIKINVEGVDGSAFDDIKKTFSDLFSDLKSSAADGDFNAAFEKMGDAAKSAASAVKEAVSNSSFGKPFETLKEESVQSFDAIKEAAKRTFESIKDANKGGNIGEAFEKIKETGTQAFDALKESGTKAFNAIKDIGSQSFSKVSDTVKGAADEVGKTLEAMGITAGRVALALGAAFTAIVTAVTLAGKTAFNFVESQSKVVNALGDVSDKTHTSIEELSKLETAYAHAGVSAGEFASGYSKLSDVVEKTWDKIKKDTEGGTNDIQSKLNAAARAQQSLTDAQRARTGDKPDTNTQQVEAQRAKDLALSEAELANSKAQKAARDAQLNDLGTITKSAPRHRKSRMY